MYYVGDILSFPFDPATHSATAETLEEARDLVRKRFPGCVFTEWDGDRMRAYKNQTDMNSGAAAEVEAGDGYCAVIADIGNPSNN